PQPSPAGGGGGPIPSAFRSLPRSRGRVGVGATGAPIDALPVFHPEPALRASLAAWNFVAPALLVLGVFFGLPVLAALLLSLTDFDLYALADPANLRFIAFDNYLDLLRTPLFWKSLGNTFYFVLVGVPLSIALSLGAAPLLHSPLVRMRALFRTALFAPAVTTLVAVAVIWRYLFHTGYGLVNWALGLVGISPVDWLGDPRWPMPTIIAFAAWKHFGYNMVIFLAGLPALPRGRREAARIAAACRCRQSAPVPRRQLGPGLVVAGGITVSGYYPLCAEPDGMTRGDPLQSTVSVLYYMFEEGFRWWNLGRA